MTFGTAAVLAVAACASAPQPPSPTPPPPSVTPVPRPVTVQPVPTVAPLATLVSPGATAAFGTPEPTPLPGNSVLGFGPLVVTLDDDGMTIYLSAGGNLLLKLGNQLDWTVTVSDQSVLSREPNVLVVAGAQRIYTAHKAGTATLSAVGDLPCRKSNPPCMAPSRLFTVTIVVSG